jgi:class 3 adenylate cyclase
MMSLKDSFHYIQKHFSTFSPGEKITVEIEIGVGAVACLDLFSQQGFGLIARGEATADVQRIAVKLTESGFEVPLPAMQPGEFNIGSLAYAGTFYAIHSGRVILDFEHSASAKGALLVAFIPIPFDTMDSNFIPPENQYSSPRLTAKRLFTSQTFHDLFRAEVFQESEGFGVKDVIILFTDLKSSTHLYQQIGDLNAFALVREHYGVLNTAILSNHGAIVKTIGDAIMATFNQPVDAVSAGLEIHRGLRQLNQASQVGNLMLKIGIHRGPAISVTLNERIDYFGQTVNIASRVENSAGGGEIYLTEAIYTAPGVLGLLQTYDCTIEPAMLQLKGIQEPVKIYKVTNPS